MKFVHVSRDSTDGLRRETWRFVYFDNHHALVLDEYHAETRLSRRHGFKLARKYDRLMSRRHATGGVDVVDRPPLPADVDVEASKAFAQTLRVLRWENLDQE